MKILQALVAAVPERETLYHYTSQAGLLGIVQKKHLWVSSIRHLNDSREFAYSAELLRTILNGRLRHENGPWNGYYDAILTGLDAIGDTTLFVGCFSENGDLLSQWRAYTPNGVGYSVGVKFTDLKSLATSQRFRLVKCSYDAFEHGLILNELIDEAAKKITGGDFREAVETFFVVLFKYAPALKHPSFAEEKEWRLVGEIVQPTDRTTRFRLGKSMLVPYGEFSLMDAADICRLSKIFIGPCPHKEQSVMSVTRLLFSEGFGHCAVAHSAVPYRSW
jgi:DUF2971 family protein